MQRGKGERCAAPELRLTQELLSPSRSTTGSRGKKHSRAVDKLEYLPVDVLRSTECRHGSIVFPQVNTVDTYTGEGPIRQSAKTPEKGNRRRRDEKGGCFIYVSFFPTTERKNTSVARLISLILASSARGLKNKFRARKCRSQFKDIFFFQGKRKINFQCVFLWLLRLLVALLWNISFRLEKDYNILIFFFFRTILFYFQCETWYQSNIVFFGAWKVQYTFAFLLLSVMYRIFYLIFFNVSRSGRNALGIWLSTDLSNGVMKRRE